MTYSQVLVIAGPTASGKSTLALNLAERVGGDVINADSLQLYRDLPLLTAQPGEDERTRVPHYLYGSLEAHDKSTAWQWAERASLTIHASFERDRLPIIVGGTGFYLRALLEGLSPIPDIPQDIRAETAALLKQHGTPYLHQLLATQDPLTAHHLSPHDPQRVSRAWSIWKATGRSFKEWQAFPRKMVDESLRFHKVLLMPEREWLYQRIDKRFLMMLEHGALEEVREFMRRPRYQEAPVFHALGASELACFLKGDISLEKAVTEAQKISRHYAKRQCTWFRRQFNPHQVFTGYEEAIKILGDKLPLGPSNWDGS